MHSPTCLTIFLFGIAHWVSGSAAAPWDSTALLDRGIVDPELRLRARKVLEAFAVSSNANMTRWEKSLEAGDSYEKRELDYICAHLAFLGMTDVVKSDLNTTIVVINNSNQSLYEGSEVGDYTLTAEENLCNIWVSKQVYISHLNHPTVALYLLGRGGNAD